MKKLFGASIAILALCTSVSFAQVSTTPGQGAGDPGRSAAVGEKDAYKPNDANRNVGSGTTTATPGVRGSGANVTDKEGYQTQDPSRTGGSGTLTNPGSAGSVGGTNTGK